MPRPKNDTVLTLRQLNRALLARQLLLERSSLTPIQAIEHLVGLQAQAPNPPYFGLWSRLSDFQTHDLSTLVRERRAVRIALMRSTIHLVSAADALALRPLVQDQISRGALRAYGPALDDVDLKALAKTAKRILDREPMTFARLGALLQQQWPDHPAMALNYVVRALVPLVQVPPRGLWGESGAAAHTSAQKWLKGEPHRALSIEEMLLRYLRAFGPASVNDMQKWSGLTRLSAVLPGMETKLLTFFDESGRKLYDVPDGPRPHEDTPAPVRLLPEWDNILLSHDDRRRVIADKHAWRLMSPNGIIPGSVFIDGFVRGLWKLRIEKRRAVVDLMFYERIRKRDREEVVHESERLLEFAAPQMQERIVKV